MGGIPFIEVPWGILVFQKSEGGSRWMKLLGRRSSEGGILFGRYSWEEPFDGVPIEESCWEEFFEESRFAEFPGLNTGW